MEYSVEVEEEEETEVKEYLKHTKNITGGNKNGSINLAKRRTWKTLNGEGGRGGKIRRLRTMKE